MVRHRIHAVSPPPPRISPTTASHPASVPSGHADVSQEAIARRAFEKFEARGCAHGHDGEDWTSAEHELRSA
jgi:hypothetical protein